MGAEVIARKRMLFPVLKLLVVSVAAVGILIGLLFGRVEYVLASAGFYLVHGVFELFHVYQEARLLRAGGAAPVRARGTLPRTTKWVEGAVLLTGFGLLIFTRGEETKGYSIAGWIIWGSAIITYFIFGVIMRDVGGVPLNMGYGGWAPRCNRKGR